MAKSESSLAALNMARCVMTTATALWDVLNRYATHVRPASADNAVRRDILHHSRELRALLDSVDEEYKTNG